MLSEGLMQAVLFTGILVWGCIAAALIWLVFEVVLGFIAACSWLHWQIAIWRKHRHHRNWVKLPGAFLRIWMRLTGYRPGSVTIEHKRGRWEGVGNWVVYEVE